MENPASKFDLAYLNADGNKEELLGLVKTAVKVGARCAMVHVGDAKFIRRALDDMNGESPHSVRSEVVIDFPDGAGGEGTKLYQAREAALYKVDGADLVINLRQVADKKKSAILRELRAVLSCLPDSKAIIQLPYLWRYHHDRIHWLLDILVEAEIKCVKDWTTRADNFSKPVAVDDDTRLAYLGYVSNYISGHNLPLLKKIAGKVTAQNAQKFLDAGADILGIGYKKAEDIKNALLNFAENADLEKSSASPDKN